MLIDHPYQYDATIRRRRKRNFDHIQIADKVTVMFEEVTGEEAPVVLTAPHSDRMSHGPQPTIEYRHWQGSFWIPVMQYQHREPATFKTAHEAAAAFFGRQHYYGTVVTLPDDSIVEILQTSQDEELAKIHQAATNLIIVEGKPFERAVEPVLNLSGRHERFPKIEIEPAIRHNANPKNTYRIDRFDDALAELTRRMGGELEAEVLTYLEQKRPTILRPDLLTYDDEMSALCDYADDILRWYDKETFQKASVAFFTAYVQIRDGVANLDAQAILAGMAAIREPEAEDERYRSTFPNEYIDEAIGRWQAASHLDPTDQAALSI